ncbi:MAG: SpoIIE family protein phosphatase [Dehalococcoidia bacterium]|nr:SpoIIE family protein phosphatase [Dehalococcoidia bacterium]
MKLRLRLSIGTKLMGSFLFVLIVSLGVLGYFTVFKMNEIGRDAEESSISLGASAAADGTRILEVLGESSIQQKAMDVAGQVSIYLASHPVNDPQDLNKDPELVKICLQTVGETGYTSLYEQKTGIMRILPNAELINYDLHNWSEKLPAWWKIYALSLDGSISSGYYDWQDADGKVREKFMYMVPVEGTPYIVAATTYIDEFSKPIVLMENRIAVGTAESTDNIQEKIENTRNFFIIFFVAVLVVVCVIVLWLSQMITTPIRALTAGSEAIGKGNLDYRVEVHSGDELEGLANSFNRMSSDLRRYTTELRRTTAEKERVEKELEIARGIQQSFLPESPPVIEGVELAALSLPAKEVGGDFYDFIPVGLNKWGLVIADVSGKGVPAALFMALSRTLVRASVSDTVTASETICKANEQITENDRSNMFVTLFYGVLDPVKMSLTYVSAGHNPPIKLSRGAQDMIMLKARGVALGVVPDMRLEEKEIALDSNDVVVLYTDGVTEAINDKEEQFGQERMLAIAEETRHLPAAEMVQRIKDAVLEFSRGQPQFDDITLMVLKIK